MDLKINFTQGHYLNLSIDLDWTADHFNSRHCLMETIIHKRRNAKMSSLLKAEIHKSVPPFVQLR